jgi:hypothetical protein
MNEYYHAFKVGFNWWEVVAVVFAILMLIIGWTTLYVRTDGKIRRSHRLVLMAPIVFGVILTVLLGVESGKGILQFLDNSLAANDSAVWSLILWPFALLFAGALLVVALYIVGFIACFVKHFLLNYYHSALKRARRIAEKRTAEERPRANRPTA